MNPLITASLIVLDVIMLAFIGFTVGRIYERRHGVYRKAYERTDKLLSDLIKEVTEKIESQSGKTMADGSMVSPFRINKF